MYKIINPPSQFVALASFGSWYPPQDVKIINSINYTYILYDSTIHILRKALGYSKPQVSCLLLWVGLLCRRWRKCDPLKCHALQVFHICIYVNQHALPKMKMKLLNDGFQESLRGCKFFGFHIKLWEGSWLENARFEDVSIGNEGFHLPC